MTTTPTATRSYKPRPFLPGNYCGHVRDKPNFTIAHGPSPNPTISNIQDAVPAIFFKWRRFKELAKRLERVWKRSERLEAIVRVSLVIFYCMDLASKRVGKVNHRRQFIGGITEDEIARDALLSLSRTKRALNDLLWAGYFVPHHFRGKGGARRIGNQQPRNEYAPGKYEGLAAVRKVAPLFLHRLGQMVKVVLAVASKNKKAKKKKQAAAAAAAPQLEGVTDPIVRSIVGVLADAHANPDSEPRPWVTRKPRPPPDTS